MWRQAASSSRHMTHCQLISFCVFTDDLHQEALWYPDSTKKMKSSSSLLEIAAHIDFVLFETSLTSPTSNIFFFFENKLAAQCVECWAKLLPKLQGYQDICISWLYFQDFLIQRPGEGSKDLHFIRHIIKYTCFMYNSVPRFNWEKF